MPLSGIVCLLALVAILSAMFVVPEVKAQSSSSDDFSLNELQGISLDDVITDIQSVGKNDESADDHLFVATRSGRIYVVNLNKGDGCVDSTTTTTEASQQLPTLQSAPFIDISTKVRSGGERGLLGLAFHPKYNSDESDDGGYFFVHYSNLDSNSVIARYRKSFTTGTGVDGGDDSATQEEVIADPNSEVILKIIEQPASNHNGGALQFSPIDGMLYIGMGDGGRFYDTAGEEGYGQKLNTYLGKILRVDVNNFTKPTSQVDDFTFSSWDIPSDNPFVNQPGVLEEIWSYGLRNPWRISFDRMIGDLYIADVGQNAYEEVNYQQHNSRGGENYGWCTCEANAIVPLDSYSHCAPPDDVNFQGCNVSPYLGPIIEYPHVGGGSITGGYIYRGELYPNLDGVYFYGDFVIGFIRGAARDDTGAWVGDALATSNSMSGDVTTFGEDSDGEIYVGTSDGYLYQIMDPSVSSELPLCNDDLPTPAPGGPTTGINFNRKKRRNTGKFGSRLALARVGVGGAAGRANRGI